MKRLVLWLLLLLLCSGTAFAAPFEDTVRILEDRTAFHWGRDCFIWIVHYSEALVDPWVDAEAGRVGMTAQERDAYRASFISHLSIGQTEPLLVTVHAFGGRPLNLAPFSDKIALVTPDGRRLKPERYDKILDQPLSGVVQGLVFFPKQNNPDFAISISGLGVFDERVFAFSGPAPYSSAPPTPIEEDEPEVIVVEIPPKPEPAPRPQPPRAQVQPAPQVIEPPVPPTPIPPPEAVPAEPTAPAAPEVIVVEPEDVAYASREQTLRRFLDLWIKSDTNAMYPMLAASSRGNFSAQEFETELRKSPDFKNAIKDGYTIEWLATDQGRVVVIRQFLFIRTLVTKTFQLIREDAAWKIVW